MLKPGGMLIWTLKLFRRSETSPALKRQIEEIRKEIEKNLEFERFEIIWLLANKNERTVVGWKKIT